MSRDHRATPSRLWIVAELWKTKSTFPTSSLDAPRTRAHTLHRPRTLIYEQKEQKIRLTSEED